MMGFLFHGDGSIRKRLPHGDEFVGRGRALGFVDRDGCVVLGRTASGPAQHSHLDLFYKGGRPYPSPMRDEINRLYAFRDCMRAASFGPASSGEPLGMLSTGSSTPAATHWSSLVTISFGVPMMLLSSTSSGVTASMALFIPCFQPS